MSKAAKGAAGGVDTIVKLIVGAGQASPSPPVGPALGSKGVKSMDFCKVCISSGHRMMHITIHNDRYVYEGEAKMQNTNYCLGIQRQNCQHRSWNANAMPSHRSA
jgi:hypothetical protein